MATGHDDVFHHVRDSHAFELPKIMGYGGEIPVPFGLSKFMVLQLVAFIAALLIFKGLARRIRSGEPAQGRWWNFWEMLALFIRDNMVRPTIGGGHHGHEGTEHSPTNPSQGHSQIVRGGHPADKYLPFVWSCFFYILFCNLLGAIPWLGAATGNINVTGALALVAFSAVVISGSTEVGPVNFWLSLVPSMDIPAAMKVVLVPFIWLIELLSLFIKHSVLAVRLFANIMAGHTVIFVLLTFIAAQGVADTSLFYLVAPASVLAQVAISTLELFVAFLQAYIFSFLTTVFISMAIHPH